MEDREAELYKAMYYKLFNAITDAMAMPVSLLRNEMLRQAQQETEEMRRAYERRRDMFTSALNSIPGVRCQPPEGAFYAWVYFDIPGMDSMQVCEYLIEHAGMRFSFAAADRDLELAAEKIRAAMEQLDH